jgi:predicted site-specific integrase-resolvase
MQLKSFDFYSLGHAARVLNVSQSSLYQWSRAGKIRTLRASDGSRLFDPKDIENAKGVAKKNRRKFVEQPAA